MNYKLVSITILIFLMAMTLGGETALADGNAPAAPLGAGFTYQGQLKDTGGNPITSTCNFRFSLWDAVSGGNQLGANSDVNGVSVAGGYFAAQVNGGNEFGNSAFNGSNARWLGVAVQCTGDAGYTALTPRQPLTPAPYALYAPAAGSAPWSGLSGVPAGFADGVDNDTINHWGATWSGTGTGLTLLGGSEGLSATASDTGVYGYATGSSGGTSGVYGKSDSIGGHGLTGVASASSGTTYGVYGVSASSGGRGLAGHASAASGTTYGVYGLSDSTGGAGVYGEAPNWGVEGEATATTGSPIGVLGQSVAPGGIGVYGNSPGYGVFGNSNSPEGYGVYGSSLAVAVQAMGYGSGASHAALRADNNSTNGVAAYFVNSSGYPNTEYDQNGSGTVLDLQNGGDVDGIGGGDFIAGYSQNSSFDMQFRITSSGQGRSDVGWTTPAEDYAEMLPAVEGLAPGDVLVIGPDGKLMLSTQAYQTNVVGVYSTQPGFIGGYPVDGPIAGTVPLAIVGVVPVKVSAENGAIQPGDLLTTSSNPGYAMRCEGADQCFGRTIGKALEALDSGTGVILVLVMLH